MAARRKKPASQYHHGDLRSAIVATAWSVVARDGLEALSLRSVAEALGVSHAAPAHHFSDKASLVAALRVEAWRRFADALEAGQGLRAIGRVYVKFARAHPRQVQLMFGPGEDNEHAARAWALLRAAVMDLLGPKISEAELDAMSAAAWSGVHGLATLPIAGGDRVTERVLDVLEAGIVSARR